MAGKQKGKEDDRYLWPEMLRVITELAPRWVIGENVPGILRIAADDVCKDLERAGYDVGIFDFEAAAVGAPHRRERIAFVAHSVRDTWGAWRPESAGQQRKAGVASGGDAVADSEKRRVKEYIASRGEARGFSGGGGRPAQPGLGGMADGSTCWLDEPDIPRVANGIPERANRLKSLGNMVVPQWAYPIFKAIMDELRGSTDD